MHELGLLQRTDLGDQRPDVAARDEIAGGEDLGARGVAAGARDRMRSSLVVAEVAFTVVLVVIGGELLGSFSRLIATDPGFEKERILASVVLTAPERYKDREQRGLFYRRILNSVRALPGVVSAGTVDALPFSVTVAPTNAL